MLTVPFDEGPRWNPYAVRGLRVRLRLTQRELARTLGVALCTVNRWERGVATPTGLAVSALTVLDRAGETAPCS